MLGIRYDFVSFSFSLSLSTSQSVSLFPVLANIKVAPHTSELTPRPFESLFRKNDRRFADARANFNKRDRSIKR